MIKAKALGFELTQPVLAALNLGNDSSGELGKTLPQGPPCSTIDAERLSFRVRNGTGRFPLAMAAETLLSFQSVSPSSPKEKMDSFSSRP